jgi:predicted transcriptional regulator of viral defense system
MSDLAGIGKSYRTKLSRVLERHSGVLTPAVVGTVLELSTQESGRLLARWHKNGWVQRVKRGVYLPVSLSSTSTDPVVEEPYLIADSIYGPGYIGGFSAVKHWDLSEQIIETINYFTLKKVRDRSPSHGGVKFHLKTISQKKFFGMKPLWIGSTKVAISDPTKTIVDLFDDPRIVGGMSVVKDIVFEYLDSEYYDFDLLVNYIKRTDNRTIFKRLGFLLETCFSMTDEQILILHSNRSEGYSQFDTTLAASTKNAKWQLMLSPSWKHLHDRKK